MYASISKCVVLMGWLAATTLGGDLDPPSGPIAPTMKALDQVEPRIAINATNTPGDGDSLFKITQPGSYYLTGNITGEVGKHGIEIASSGVTIDLNGFDLVGVPGMGAFDGVSATVTFLTDIEVRNGSVRNWGDAGIDLGSSVAYNSRVESVRASDNNGNGISVGIGSTITGCTAYLNTGSGISASSSATITGCTAYQNTFIGISIGIGSTITDCTAYLNSSAGINAVFDCTVTDCTASANSVNGIQFQSSCVIRGNLCSGNGAGGNGAGIQASGNDNRIEGNNCTGADRGIDVDSAGNIIIKNTCSGNATNWDVVAGNVILVVNATAAGAVVGNSGGTAPGSTDPNANFTY